MSKTEKRIGDVLLELMNAYDTNRDRWYQQFGNTDGFDEWFTKQCGIGTEVKVPEFSA